MKALILIGLVVFLILCAPAQARKDSWQFLAPYLLRLAIAVGVVGIIMAIVYYTPVVSFIQSF